MNSIQKFRKHNILANWVEIFNLKSKKNLKIKNFEGFEQIEDKI